MTPTSPRVLVMRYRFLGDTVLAVPMLRALRQALGPQAVIDVLVAPDSGDLLRDCPYINDLIFFGKGRADATKGFWPMAKILRARRYDTVFVLKRSLSSAVLAWLTGARTRVGFNTEGRGLLLTHRVPYAGGHEAERFLSVLPAAGLPASTDTRLELWWGQTEAEAANARLAGCLGDPVALHLVPSNPGKQWPLARFIELAQRLVAEGHSVHLVGGKADAQAAQTLKAAVEGPVYDHCGQTSLLETVALLAQMRRVIGADSGVLHLAAAVGVPVTALFGPMDETMWRPLGPDVTVVTAPVPCRPCHLKIACPHAFRCMSEIAVGDVLPSGSKPA
jgi:heptosyltransferase-2